MVAPIYQMDGHVLKSQLDFTICAHLSSAPFGTPALHVDGHGIAGDVGPGGLDVHGEGGSVAAETLRADAGLVDDVEKFFLESSHLRIRVF